MKNTYFILQTKLKDGDWFGDKEFQDLTEAREDMADRVEKDKRIGVDIEYRILKVRKEEILRS